jgi:hypothetical protein
MTLIGIGCLKSVDTNNYFWYPLEITDTKKTSFFVSYKWYRPAGPLQKIPVDSIDVFCSSTIKESGGRV